MEIQSASRHSINAPGIDNLTGVTGLARIAVNVMPRSSDDNSMVPTDEASTLEMVCVLWELTFLQICRLKGPSGR
jgi:hypothetical protein